ncbi:PhzF family phenazine biosynthesis protein [Streptosporangium sp. NPDC050855]|uniref:PhzF family phenazine biosynthesis protein n=1 Tax=Streptosporangium sp. NPDC050855 TaxID=3366194 RepID=UPI0037970755
MAYHFALVDVFSDRPFGGNQLAVFPDAEGIGEQTMQQLAREFNFSETTFVLPPRDPTRSFRVRIFTPDQELPFAGHPTVGTAAVLAGSGPARQTFVFEEGIGPVTVTVEGGMIRLHLQDPVCETTDEAPPATAVARALALPEEAIVDSWYAGIGLRFCFVRLTGRESVDQARLDRTAWEAAIAERWSPHLYVFAGDLRDGAHVYSRFFAPAVGVDEDPATGSAAASLVAGLAQRSPGRHGTYRLRISQGVAMGRPSTLQGTAHKENGLLTQVIVGGNAVVVGSGTMDLPAEAVRGAR